MYCDAENHEDTVLVNLDYLYSNTIQASCLPPSKYTNVGPMTPDGTDM